MNKQIKFGKKVDKRYYTECVTIPPQLSRNILERATILLERDGGWECNKELSPLGENIYLINPGVYYLFHAGTDTTHVVEISAPTFFSRMTHVRRVK